MLLGLTDGELLEQFYEDLYVRKAELEARLEDENLPNQQALELQRHLRKLEQALGERGESEDPLADYWDAEIEAGREPDFEMTLEDLRLLREEERYA